MKVGKGRPTPILDKQNFFFNLSWHVGWGGGVAVPQNLASKNKNNKMNYNKINGGKNQLDVQILIREG